MAASCPHFFIAQLYFESGTQDPQKLLGFPSLGTTRGNPNFLQKAPPPWELSTYTGALSEPTTATTTTSAQQLENMADRGTSAPRGGGFAARGDRGGDRGRGRGGRRGGRRGGGKSDEKEWQPVTKLGRLVKAGKIKSMEEIYLHSLPIKEYQIVDFFLPKLKDEVMKARNPESLICETDH